MVFIGSGNIVHALNRVKWERRASRGTGPSSSTPTPRTALRERRTDLLLDPYGTWAEARIAVPTDDHYRPMVASLSLLDDDEDIRFFNDAIDLGSVGMRSFVTA